MTVMTSSAVWLFNGYFESVRITFVSAVGLIKDNGYFGYIKKTVPNNHLGPDLYVILIK